MKHPTVAAVVLVLLCGLAACGRSGVTAPRLENAVARTFANLVHAQSPLLDGPPIDVAALRATASCQKPSEPVAPRGGGSWRCTVTWSVPGRAAPVHDTYDVAVTMDGCYTATADGAEAHVGGPALKAASGATVPNLLYAFDGCFDPS